MTSPGYIGEGSSWRSSSLPSRLLMSMMLMIMITFSYTQDSVEMTSLTPVDGFTIGGGNTMNITCSYNMSNLLTFDVIKNNITVQAMQLNVDSGMFEIVQTRGFDCTLPRTRRSGLVNCWKSNLTCDDVASYTCSTNTVTSSPKSLKVKSSIKNMTRVDSHLDGNKISTFKCTANAALPSTTPVKFQWKIQLENRQDPIYEDKETIVPNSTEYYAVASSQYQHNDTLGALESISCTVFGQTMVETFHLSSTTPTEIPTTTRRQESGSGTANTKRSFVVKLILLLLSVAVSR